MVMQNELEKNLQEFTAWAEERHPMKETKTHIFCDICGGELTDQNRSGDGLYTQKHVVSIIISDCGVEEKKEDFCVSCSAELLNSIYVIGK